VLAHLIFPFSVCHVPNIGFEFFPRSCDSYLPFSFCNHVHRVASLGAVPRSCSHLIYFVLGYPWDTLVPFLFSHPTHPT
jgi:hypothetical protein